VQRAQARFAANEDFDFSVFGERFDFVIARSIWTHASKPQLSAMLRSFGATSEPEGVFLASYYPATTAFKLGQRWPKLERLVTRLPLAEASPFIARLPALWKSSEYEGAEWVGRSHNSDVPGALRHNLRWIAAEAARHGLVAQLMPYRVMHHQYWLRIARARAGSL
jgi:hypothetical protein